MNGIESFATLCFRLGVEVSCPHCQSIHIIKNGKNAKGKQRYKCKECQCRFMLNYDYKAYVPTLNKQIIQFIKENLSIRSTKRVLQISTTTLLLRIILIAKNKKDLLFHYVGLMK